MERGWIRTELENSADQVCLVGARTVAIALGGGIGINKYQSDSASDAIESVIPAVYLEDDGYDCEGETRMWVFNDVCKSVNEVLAVIDDAILAEKEKLV